MRKIKIVLEYDGSRFGGWQLQKNATTIQGKLEEALGRVLGEKVRVHGAGRTDAGVHALGQVAHFEIKNSLPLKNIQAGGNRYLPPEIVIRRIETAPPDFHARYRAREKIYRYLIYRRKMPSPFRQNRAYHYPYPLDLKKMHRGARFLTGRHDFAAFAASGSSVRDTTRHLTGLKISDQGELLTLEFRADGFLYKMVRNIVGTLLKVGQGKISPEELKAIRESRDRRRAGPTAPPDGLYLVRVIY